MLTKTMYIHVLDIPHQKTSKLLSIGLCRLNHSKNAMKVSSTSIKVFFFLHLNRIHNSRFNKIEIQELKISKSLALEDILHEVHLFVMRSKSSFSSLNLFLVIHKFN